ncbi:AMP-binding protein [Cytobacillus oceanisediminis]|uniref:AMP-binding protein n=1 Tax=Cytobacillus oceanisediminis TaxID=665099 RepID=UPI0023DAF76E|nr:AMP-binding protein [Cytobacillus oceanisediminis]MDF2040276.1 AMP-binding protein [Cytobacillus oceanisediminis]
MFFVNDQYYTLDDLEQQYTEFENTPHLRDCGNRRLAVCMPDVFQWLALCLFVRRKGGSIVPIHPSVPKEGAIRMSSSAGSHILLYGNTHTPIELSEQKNAREGVLVQMSSGTTGAPKCIERSWESIELELESYVSVLPADHQTTSIVACPVTHSYGLICGVFASLRRGAEPVILSNMNPKYVLKKIKEHPKHILYGAPALLHTLTLLIRDGARFDCVMTSGTLMPSVWLESLKSITNRVLQQYGCSEAGCVAIHPDVSDPREMGYPLPHVNVEAGSREYPGEIIIRDSEKTIFTKDLGYVEDGVLSFLARMDDTINVAGLNVYPQEVEDVLMAEPRIAEAVVYKKIHPLSGERVCAQYVCTQPIEEQELREWCREYLAPYQIPMEFIQTEEIEKLPNGKISRKRLGEGVLA